MTWEEKFLPNLSVDSTSCVTPVFPLLFERDFFRANFDEKEKGL